MKNVNSYPKEVQEIHHAFENAGENILAEAHNTKNSGVCRC